MTEKLDKIDYAKLIDESMHLVVKKALKIVADKGLPGENHFFISFLTNHPGIVISKKLYNKYPEEMTIVLQHQYHDLRVYDDKFSVTLIFGGVSENIIIPYSALTAFADPSVKFGLQFNSHDTSPYNGSSAHHHNLIATNKEAMQKIIKEKTTDKKTNKKQNISVKDDNIVDFNTFKNKHKA